MFCMSRGLKGFFSSQIDLGSGKLKEKGQSTKVKQETGKGVGSHASFSPGVSA